ncbi:MAG: elongation factor P [Pseudomonadota bacterium]
MPRSMNAKSIKPGMILQVDGQLFRVLSAKHLTPGNLGALVQTKLRGVKTDIQTERRFRAQEDVERVYLENREIEFLYKDGDIYHFMDTETYEQFHLSAEILGDATLWLTPNLKLKVERFEEQPIGVELPDKVKVKITHTEPFMKSATVTNAFKAAEVETGATVQVPGFISEGETIEVDTTTGEYLGRAK